MEGYNVLYPIGWDDNGLPTERRVQNYYNIACNPKVAYEPNFKPVHIENNKEEQLSRTQQLNTIRIQKKKDILTE